MEWEIEVIGAGGYVHEEIPRKPAQRTVDDQVPDADKPLGIIPTARSRSVAMSIRATGASPNNASRSMSIGRGRVAAG
jgi:hypothetical protein